MRKICKILSFILLLFLLTISTNLFALQLDESVFSTITTNPGVDCASQMNIVWHTDVSNTSSYLVYTKKSDTNWNEQIKVMPTVTYDKTFKSLNASGEEFNKNTIELSGLDSDTHYMYKVCDEEHESKVHYFKTSGEEFSFAWISDFHAYYDNAVRLNNAQAVIDDCIKLNGGVDFVFSTGDIIAHGGTYKWWKQVASSNFMREYMFASTLGNHDWMTSVKDGTYKENGASSSFFSACSNYPKNGYSGQENVCYYFYYGDALFICMNTEEYTQAQKTWVTEVLEKTKGTSQYIFLFQHYQAFNGSGAKNSSGYTRWHELCDEYGVDVFFSGNSHIYIRSNSIYKDKASTDPLKGTVYLVAPSSDGDRGMTFSGITSNASLIAKGWGAGNAQVAASVVNVTKDGIVTKLVNKGGEILDSAFIPAKRFPTSRSSHTLEGVDKEKIENNIKIQKNPLQLNSPKISLPTGFAEAIRSITVSNNKTNKIYFDTFVSSTTKYLELSGVEKGELEIKLTLEYYDNEQRELILELNNNYSWGSITKEKIVEDSGGFTLNWNETIKENYISKIEIFINDELYQEVAFGTKTCTLPDVNNKVNKVKIVVTDIDGDIVYQKELEYGKLLTHIVTYIGLDGKVLKQEEVIDGGSTIEYIPEEKGYIFISWDNDLSNVTSDITVKAIYKKLFEVTFVGMDGEVILKTTCVEGEQVKAPEAPTIDGYTFKNWEDYSNITSDITIKAIYEKNVQKYIVTFVDDKGNIIDTQTVEEGKNATAPKVDAPEGYEASWDKPLKNITEDTIITLVLKEKVRVYKVTFIGKNGEVLLTIEVEEGKDATAPTIPTVDGYKFVKWDKELTNITSDCEIHAVYQTQSGCNAAATYIFLTIQFMCIISLFTRKRY